MFHRRVKPARNNDARGPQLANRVVRLDDNASGTTDGADQPQWLCPEIPTYSAGTLVPLQDLRRQLRRVIAGNEMHQVSACTEPGTGFRTSQGVQFGRAL